MNRTLRTTIAAASLALAVGLAAGCGSDKDNDGASASGPLPQGSEKVDLNPADFTTNIDNRYWPMAPGSRWVYLETDNEGSVQRVVVTVTDRTKKVANGITARVVHDVATEGAKPVEVTDDWYAQDSEGNVWYLGEDTAEYKNGKPATTAGSFEAGVDGAQPGIVMAADPQPGMTYRQEYYADEAEDKASIVSLSEQVEVPAGHFTNVAMTKEVNPLEPKALEYKFYAPNIGPVLAITVSGGSDREQLIRFTPPGK